MNWNKNPRGGVGLAWSIFWKREEREREIVPRGTISPSVCVCVVGHSLSRKKHLFQMKKKNSCSFFYIVFIVYQQQVSNSLFFFPFFLLSCARTSCPCPFYFCRLPSSSKEAQTAHRNAHTKLQSIRFQPHSSMEANGEDQFRPEVYRQVTLHRHLWSN